MIEWLAIPCAMVAAALMPSAKMKDKDKIKKVFEVGKVGVKKGDDMKYPKLIKEITGEDYTTYLYSLPLGIPSKVMELLIPSLEDGLNKTVEYEFEDGLVKLHVFETELPKRWDYDTSLIRPGTWEVPIGKNHHGILYHDFDKYQHLLMGGVTRYGKTVCIKEIMNTLISNNPNDIDIYILDLKAGLEFYKYKVFPQVKEVACDVFESAKLLDKLTNELKQTEVFFRTKGWTNIVDTPIKKRTFILVDEGAELSPDIIKDKTAKKFAAFCQAALSEIARISGGLGYRLIYCTQYPTKQAVPQQVKINIVARLAFVCTSGVASEVILDERGAEKIPSIPGRAIYLVDKPKTIQVPYIDDKMIFKMNKEQNNHVTVHTKPSRTDVGDSGSSWHRENKTPPRNPQAKL
ncbi:MAG: FtsK/SpoIIIE domain-containing protein [Bacillota bacterium]|nr:FtsK/SpoIIIE domain-containing protein [Bacillota bacterium]